MGRESVYLTRYFVAGRAMRREPVRGRAASARRRRGPRREDSIREELGPCVQGDRVRGNSSRGFFQVTSRDSTLLHGGELHSCRPLPGPAISLQAHIILRDL